MLSIEEKMMTKLNVSASCRTTPLKSIRKKCLDCVGSNRSEITKCQETGSTAGPSGQCDLYHYRSGKRSKLASLSSLKSIRKYCLWCMCGQSNEVKLCVSPECALFTYRLGKNPARKGLCGKPPAHGRFLSINRLPGGVPNAS